MEKSQNQLIEEMLVVLNEIKGQLSGMGNQLSKLEERQSMIEEMASSLNEKVDETLTSIKAIENKMNVIAADLLTIKGQLFDHEKRIAALEAA